MTRCVAGGSSLSTRLAESSPSVRPSWTRRRTPSWWRSGAWRRAASSWATRTAGEWSAGRERGGLPGASSGGKAETPSPSYQDIGEEDDWEVADRDEGAEEEEEPEAGPAAAGKKTKKAGHSPPSRPPRPARSHARHLHRPRRGPPQPPRRRPSTVQTCSRCWPSTPRSRRARPAPALALPRSLSLPPRSPPTR